MGKGFYFSTFLILGSSYMSAYAFGAMHKIHHAYADKELDPHSPIKSPGYFGTLLQARNSYFKIFIGKTKVDPSIVRGLPAWHSFDRFAHSWITRSLWVLLYIYLYITLATA
jgi:stearoyl-CoA desaturase (delta-9 desaturase)